jgi:hypothetical protein
MRASTKIEARGNQRGRLKDCRTSPGSDGSFGIPHKSGQFFYQEAETTGEAVLLVQPVLLFPLVSLPARHTEHHDP